MSRRSEDITIDAEGRDKGKRFRLTELPASQGERWAQRALFAIGKANPEMPSDLSLSGMAGIAALGIRAIMSMPWEDAEPLLAEMFTCVQALPESGPRPLLEEDIEEIATRVRLRDEVFKLHTGFSLAALLSTLGQAAKAAVQAGQKPSTSRRSSRRSSQRDEQPS